MNLQDRIDQLMALAKHELAAFAAQLEGFCEVTPEEKAAAFVPDVVSVVTVDVGGTPVDVIVSHDKADEPPVPEVVTAPKADPVVAQLATDEVLAAPAPATEMLDVPTPVEAPAPVAEVAPVAEPVVAVEVPAPAVPDTAAPDAPAPVDLRALSKAPGQ